jgi:hypothetical protein
VTMERKEQGLLGEYVPEIGQRHWRQPEDEKGELYVFERQIHSPSTPALAT